MLQRAADEHYSPDGPLCRVIVAEGPAPRVCVAGHHAVLDGLGLVALLGVVAGKPLGTTARGADPLRARPRGGIGYPLRRLSEAVLRPPARIAAEGGSSEARDHLVRRQLDRRITSAELIASAAAAVRDWNSAHRRPEDRVVVAVGASRIPGSRPMIGTQATWFRIDVADGDDPETVRAALLGRGPEPRESFAIMRLAQIAGLAGMLERRTGSTLLVSHLGSIVPAGGVVEAAFFPAAHGRSGVALGGVTVDGRTTLTLRARG
jgi:hypothetical protein